MILRKNGTFDSTLPKIEFLNTEEIKATSFLHKKNAFLSSDTNTFTHRKPFMIAHFFFTLLFSILYLFEIYLTLAN